MRLFKNTPYWNSQYLGVAGVILLVLALRGPLLQYPVAGGFMGLPRVSNGPSMLTSPDVLMKLGGFVVLLLNCAAVWALFTLRYEILKRITLAIVILAFVVTIAGIKNIDVYDDLSASSLIPAYFPAGQQVALGWAWLALLLAPLLLWLSATAVSEPSDEERTRVLAAAPSLYTTTASIPRTTANPLHASSTPSARPAAVRDVGTCTACKATNSLRATRCHQCGVTLPWEDARIDEAARKQKLAPGRGSSSAFADSAAGRIFIAGIVGFLIFWFSFIPFVGYFFWRHLDNEGSKYSGASLAGCILGVVFFLGGFLMRLLGAMAKVGAN